MAYKLVTLAIFDGLGVAPDSDGNAVTRAKMPNFKNYIKNYPVMTVFASGNEVGLSFGEMGNSEVGHLNIGAGRVYYQSCPRINNEIGNGEFFKNTAFLGALEHIKKNKSNLHLIGLLGIGNVHASDSHLYALLDFCAQNKLEKNVFVHGVLDGRDALYNSGKNFVTDLLAKMKVTKVGQIASLSGRFYALDRDNRWDRCEKAYQAMALGKADRNSDDPLKIIDESYEQKNYDEEFVPTVITKGGKPVATIKENDAVIFFNFRPDRARELTKAFVLPGFNKFEREYIKNLFFVTMTEFEKDLPAVVAYPPIVVHNSLAETVSKAGKKQFHVAETEKYAHITFFLNGTVEEPFAGEDRMIVPSPKVSSYSEAPEMSAALVSKEAVKAIDSGKYDLVALNFANADMVGHTGDLAATIKGCEAADKALGEVVEHTLAKGGVVVITADHGNAEEVINLQTGAMDKEHSTNPVPLLVVGKDFEGQAGPAGEPPEGDLSLMHPVGVLADVAPTVLSLMGVPQPPEMTGAALI
ncbi:MAG: 2,3-bisphosphoglycerate-independent phosphoglycerate mutase [Candidatus Magasanikbacteria bacterium]